MTAIGPPSLLLAAIRRQALAWRRRASTRPRAGASETTSSRPSSPQDWSAEVARAVVAIAPDDPGRNRKAFRAYLAAVLAKECGFQHLDDPGFQGLVTQVQESMDADRRLREAMEAAGRMLLESAGR